MSWVVYDFECEECGNIWNDLVKRDNIESECPECKHVTANKLFPTPALATMAMKTPEERSAVMAKRSAEHTQKELRKEPERYGPEGIKRARKGEIRSK